MDFPRSPWRLRGEMLLSLWWVDRAVTGTAFVDYQPGGDLTYRELLCAKPVRHGVVPAVRITDIWVDSVPSRDGGRALWAIPKELAQIDAGDDAWSATTDGPPIAAARFQRGRHLPGRWPLRLRTSQTRGDDVIGASVRGSATVQVATAAWTVAPDGALHRLAHKRPFLSLVLADFRISFG